MDDADNALRDPDYILYARIWPRMKAILIDALILMGVFLAAALVGANLEGSGAVAFLVWVAFWILYDPLMVSRTGGTIGHHLQNQAGALSGGRSNADSVETELQADCLAGVWAASANRRKLLEMGDFDEALGAAAAIGDDTIQKKSQGYVQPESWTHGSSQQRVAAFRKGFDGGNARTCGL